MTTTGSLSPHDLLIAPEAIPLSDHIIQVSNDDRIFFYPYHVRQLLRFLECIVLYDRIVVGGCQIGSSFSAQVQDSDLFRRYSAGWIINPHVPVAELVAKVDEQLTTAGVLKREILSLQDLSTRDLFESQLLSSPLLRKQFETMEHTLQSEEPDPEFRRELAFLITWTHIGGPLYLAEVARQLNVAFQLGDTEAQYIAHIEAEERKTLAGVVRRLPEYFNVAARAEIERVQSLAGLTALPVTPLAWQILAGATNAEDLPRVALQLRDEYAQFRTTIQQLENELRSDDVTLARKTRIIAEIDRVVNDLWPAERRGFRRELISAASAVAALPIQAPQSIPSLASAVTAIISAPVDVLLRTLARRRYRVLFRSKRLFMKAKGAVSKLSSIFQLPREIVMQGLDEERATLRKTA